MGHGLSKPESGGAKNTTVNTGQIAIVTPRMRAEYYDWLWYQSYYNNTSRIHLDITHFEKTCVFPKNRICLSMALTLNDVWIQLRGEWDINSRPGPNEYLCLWKSDIILADNTLEHALSTLRNPKVAVAGVGGWHVDHGFRGAMFAPNAPNEDTDFLEWFVVRMRDWKYLKVPGEQYVEAEDEQQIRLKDSGRLIVNLPDPYLHFGDPMWHQTVNAMILCEHDSPWPEFKLRDQK